jgi:clan AA aspartic protease (TIGR02281 family)
VTAPLLLDTGASHTILTRQTARELGLPPVERLPRKAFHTAGGVVLSPVTTLQSVRVGSHEVRDVEVAIDVAEHLSIGLLGMTFLRHFKVTVNQEQDQVKFER